MKRQKTIAAALILFGVGCVFAFAHWAVYGLDPADSTKAGSPDGAYAASLDRWDGWLHGTTFVRLKPTHSLLPPVTVATGEEICGVKWTGPRTLQVSWQASYSGDTLGPVNHSWHDVRIDYVAQWPPFRDHSQKTVIGRRLNYAVRR